MLVKTTAESGRSSIVLDSTYSDMSFQLTVRPATTNDVYEIQRVARAVWQSVYTDILGAETVEAMLDAGYTDSILERMINLDDVGLFVATADGDVVGYASCGVTDPDGVGDLDLYVHPDYWGEGIGTELLEAGKNHLCELSVETVQDEVLVDNESGNAFYQKHFERVEERSTMFGDRSYPVNVYELSL